MAAESALVTAAAAVGGLSGDLGWDSACSGSARGSGGRQAGNQQQQHEPIRYTRAINCSQKSSNGIGEKHNMNNCKLVATKNEV